jgi:GTPase
MAEENFVDYVKIFCASGKGGAGSAHLRREKFIPKGGPDGGDGGRGGHVILKGNAHMWTLLHLKYQRHFKAENGASGGKQQSTGANGEDVVIDVPLGTVVRDPETGDILGEITRNGETHVLMQGGRGGQGNVHFKTSTRQTPRFAQPGEPGTQGWRILELKILADVGLVGYPNAGKSTLLSVVSAAKPKIAAYPFTTLTPNLGMVSYREQYSFVMADIPGIIEGAHKGKGLGLRFLKHIERNAMLLFMVPVDSINPRKEYCMLLNELKKYNPQLLDKDRLLIISKSDMLDKKRMKEISSEIKDFPHIFISSVTGYNIPLLKDKIWETLNR